MAELVLTKSEKNNEEEVEPIDRIAGAVTAAAQTASGGFGVFKRAYPFVMRLVIALLCGIIGGLIGSVFHICLENASEIFNAEPWLLFLMPVSGVLIIFLYRIAKVDISAGTNNVIESVRTSTRLPYMLLPLIIVGTLLTHLVGGSSGREGAALQIGGVVGDRAGRIFKMDSKDINLAVMCGMSAVFAAVFGTPMTAVIFSIEVVSVGVLYYAALIPCLAASYSAYFISVRVFGATHPKLIPEIIPQMSADVVIKVIVLAALCGVLSIFFCLVMKYCHRMLKGLFYNDYIRITVGGVILIALTLLVGSRNYNGAGMNVIERAIAGDAAYEAFILKIIFTAITLGAGFKGGEIFPTFFIGSTFGCIAGSLLGLPGGFGAAIGLCAVFCGVVNSPISALFLAYELFGNVPLPIFFVAIAVSYVCSGYHGIYGSQKILYSKYRLEFINKSAR